MNRHTVQGEWRQSKGKVRERWGKPSDHQLGVVAGRRDQLIGRMQELYGLGWEEAEQRVDSFQRRYRHLFHLA